MVLLLSMMRIKIVGIRKVLLLEVAVVVHLQILRRLQIKDLSKEQWHCSTRLPLGSAAALSYNMKDKRMAAHLPLLLHQYIWFDRVILAHKLVVHL